MDNTMIGQKVLIRTVIYHYIGRIAAVTDEEVRLEDASWLAESERWHVTLETGAVRELEPYPNGVTVRLASIVDYCPWDHELPREPV